MEKQANSMKFKWKNSKASDWQDERKLPKVCKNDDKNYHTSAGAGENPGEGDTETHSRHERNSSILDNMALFRNALLSIVNIFVDIAFDSVWWSSVLHRPREQEFLNSVRNQKLFIQSYCHTRELHKRRDQKGSILWLLLWNLVIVTCETPSSST